MASRRRILLVAFVLLVAAWALLEVQTGGDAGLLYIVPLLALGAPLLAGRYVGEELVLTLAGRRAARPGRRAARVAAPRGRARSMARGGRLVARSLAERGPPRAAAGLST
jgi:hypothetical protein